MNVMSRIDQAGLRLTEIGLDLQAMVADGVIDPQEIRKLQERADDLLEEAVEIEDVALDVECARQVLRIGRTRTPNRELGRKIVSFEGSQARLSSRKRNRISADTGDAA